MLKDIIATPLNLAVQSAKLAYQFSPGSYTYDAFLQALKARDAWDAWEGDWGHPRGHYPDEGLI
jgi:hypothetical protein